GGEGVPVPGRLRPDDLRAQLHLPRRHHPPHRRPPPRRGEARVDARPRLPGLERRLAERGPDPRRVPADPPSPLRPRLRTGVVPRPERTARGGGRHTHRRLRGTAVSRRTAQAVRVVLGLALAVGLLGWGFPRFAKTTWSEVLDNVQAVSWWQASGFL